ncbi:metallophosphoesterase, partial [Candidatus Latescibacterota bacterium]
FIDNEKQDELFYTWIAAPPGANEQAWLESKLAASNKPFKIVSMHHPLVSFNEHSGDWDNEDFGRDLVEKRKRMIRLLMKYNVRIVFCGHEHLYEHNIIRPGDREKNQEMPLHVIVTGGGGVPLRRKSSSEHIEKCLDNFAGQGLDVIQEASEEIHHFCLVTVDTEKVTVNVHEVTENAEKTRLQDQIVIDYH